jgi:hypothetical protein
MESYCLFRQCDVGCEASCLVGRHVKSLIRACILESKRDWILLHNFLVNLTPPNHPANVLSRLASIGMLVNG